MTDSGLEVGLEPAPGAPALERLWLDLEARADVSFFQSWGWIGCWLERTEARPLLLTVREDGELVGLGLFCEARLRRHGFVASRALLLHETGRPRFDALTIERNGLLAARGREGAVAAAALAQLGAALEAGRWDEVILSGVPPLYQETARRRGIQVSVWKDRPCHLIDLAAIRASGGDYLSRLGKKTRQHLRRSLRLYEERGPLTVTPADSTREALVYLDELVGLHRADWEGRGRETALSDDWFVDFHRALLRGRFEAGEIQLLRITAGAHLIGLLYHFTWRGRVISYQWGLAPERDPKVNYGLAADALAVQHNLEAGYDLVDFLQGDSLHKRRLGTDEDRALWIALQRPRLVFRLEEALRRLKRRWEGRQSSGAASTEMES